MQRNSAGGDTFSWGISKWGQMFSDRQLLAMQTLVDCIPDELETSIEGSYEQAVLAYLGIWIDRFAQTSTSFGRIDVTGEKIQTPFARQAIPMIFDYPESNPFSAKTGSAQNQLAWVIRYIEGAKSHFQSTIHNAASGDKRQFDSNVTKSRVGNSIKLTNLPPEELIVVLKGGGTAKRAVSYTHLTLPTKA